MAQLVINPTTIVCNVKIRNSKGKTDSMSIQPKSRAVAKAGFTVDSNWLKQNPKIKVVQV